MNEAEKRKKRLCFTGHRPEKLHHNEDEACSMQGVKVNIYEA